MVLTFYFADYGVHHLDEMEEYMKELEEERGQGKAGVISVGQWELHPWLGRYYLQNSSHSGP